MEFIETIINGLKSHFVDKKYGVDKRFGAKKNGVALVSVGGEWTEQDGYGYQYIQDSHDTIGEILSTDDFEDWGVTKVRIAMVVQYLTQNHIIKMVIQSTSQLLVKMRIIILTVILLYLLRIMAT